MSTAAALALAAGMILPPAISSMRAKETSTTLENNQPLDTTNGQGGILLPEPLPTTSSVPSLALSPSPKPGSTPEITPSLESPGSRSKSAKPRPTIAPEPLRCSIGVNNYTISDDGKMITVAPYVTGNTPDPATGYIFLDRGTGSFEGHLGIDKPFTTRNAGIPIAVYFAGVDDMPEGYRPQPGDPNPRLSEMLMLGKFGMCGAIQ